MVRLVKSAHEQVGFTPRQVRSFREGVAFSEEFFLGVSEVQKALNKVCAALEADGIPYAVAGAMALNAHGYRRVTTVVDLLLTREGLASFKARHLGLGWVENFPGSKGMRDTEYGVKIDVILTGDFPGDGKPKAVAFPDPSVARRNGAVMVLPLRDLVELKLASGMSNPGRMKDLADVQEVIKHVDLPAELGDDLDPLVRDEYLRIWKATRDNPEDE